MRANNLIGQRFGSLVVVEKAPSSGASKWLCKCDCGQNKVIFGANLTSGRSTSCGCSQKKHDDSKSALYNVYNQKKRQGMCEEWANDYMAFKNWAMANGYEDGLRIERVETDKPVGPDNCRITGTKNDEYKSFLKTVGGGEGDRCVYPTRLDMYGRGCQHNCQYCYARSLLDFRGLWNEVEPSCADKEKVLKALNKIAPGTVLRLGGMTDPYQPLEAEKGLTRWLIGQLNDRGIGYLIVTKSALIERDIDILRKDLAHVQISYTYSNEKPSPTFENASDPEDRLRVADALYDAGIDVQLRLSPCIPELIDLNRVKACKVDKVLVEFLRINSMIIKKMPWLENDKFMWTEKSGNYYHIPLRGKIAYLERLKSVTGKTVTVCEDEPNHYNWFKNNFNPNPEDCCNLRK